MPLYTFECNFGHVFEAIRNIDCSGFEVCEVCDSEGRKSVFANRIMSAAGIHIPGRSVARKLHDDTIDFANKNTIKAEKKARKVQPLR